MERSVICDLTASIWQPCDFVGLCGLRNSYLLPEYLYAVVLIPSLYPPDLTNPKLELWMIVELKPKLLWELGLDPNLLQVLFFLLEPF